jgi:hypothetical protein
MQKPLDTDSLQEHDERTDRPSGTEFVTEHNRMIDLELPRRLMLDVLLKSQVI